MERFTSCSFSPCSSSSWNLLLLFLLERGGSSLFNLTHGYSLVILYVPMLASLISCFGWLAYKGSEVSSTTIYWYTLDRSGVSCKCRLKNSEWMHSWTILKDIVVPKNCWLQCKVLQNWDWDTIDAHDDDAYAVGTTRSWQHWSNGRLSYYSLE